MLDEENFNLNGSNLKNKTFKNPSRGLMISFLITHSAGIINTPKKAMGVLVVIVMLMLTTTALLLADSRPEVTIDPTTGYPVNQHINPAFR
jgi:hypothetical protein